MMRGEADVLHDVSVESLDFVEAESTVQTFSFVKAYYHALVFNLTLPLFAQKDVRRALEHGGRPEAGCRCQPQEARHSVGRTDLAVIILARSGDQPTYEFDPAGRSTAGRDWD